MKIATCLCLLTLPFPLLAEPDGEAPWDEFAVTMSQDEHAADSGSSDFPHRAASLQLTPLPENASDILDLNGSWHFKPNPPQKKFLLETAESIAGWDTIEVPGDFAMQGRDTACGGYARVVAIPAAWEGSRVKIRFDEVASAAHVWVNGKPAGEHVGHFIPFELDITKQLEFGADNLITVLAHKGSLARRMSGYAVHAGGGITRGARIFRVPTVHVSRLHATTDFDENYENAQLQIDLSIANAGDNPADVELDVQLLDTSGKAVPLAGSLVKPPSLSPRKLVRRTVSLTVPRPLHWTAESPNLYDLIVALQQGGKTTSSCRRRIGFRELEIRGKELLVNGHPIKLRGSNRHLAHPLRGRSLIPELARLDARLFKQANCNFIRTSHYPPSEEFIEACDELGLYVEVEAPFCFFNHEDGRKWNMDAVTRYVTYANLKMVERDRSHPSVILWSIGNESRWGAHFAAAAKAVAEADPTRGRTFMWWDKEAEHLTVEAEHYPGPDGVTRCHGEMPKIFSEYCHLPAYAPHEMYTDPAVEYQWGEVIRTTWNNLYQTEGALGGAIWCGIDDRFHRPIDGGFEVRGVAPWGILDGWRRRKPAFYHTQRAYCPVHIPVSELDLPAQGEPLRIPVENRHDFTNLNELHAMWKIGDQNGRQAFPDLPPRKSGQLLIQNVNLRGGEVVQLFFTDSAAKVLTRIALTVSGRPEEDALEPTAVAPADWSLQEKAGIVLVRGGEIECRIDGASGRITSFSLGDTPLLIGGPRLAIVPTFSQLQQRAMKKQPIAPTPVYGDDWRLENLNAEAADGRVEVRWTGRYREANLSGCYHFTPGGGLAIDYRIVPGPGIFRENDLVWRADQRTQRAFVRLKDEITAIVAHPNRGDDQQEVGVDQICAVPRQLGLILELPRRLDTLKWKRIAPANAYPLNLIGRPTGSATAFSSDGDTTPRLGEAPSWLWQDDACPLGTRDFRSTKSGILHASLTDEAGAGIQLISDGSHASRSYVIGDRVHWLVASKDGGPSESFQDNYFGPRRIHLKLGEPITDTIRLRVIGGE